MKIATCAAAAVLFVAISIDAARAASRTPSDELYWRVHAAEDVFGGNDNDISRDHIRQLKADLLAALDAFRRSSSKSTDASTEPAHVYKMLGRLSLFEGQFAEAERFFEKSMGSFGSDRFDRDEALNMQRARATALVLDGRFDAAAKLLAQTPLCSTPGQCDLGGSLKGCAFYLHLISFDGSAVWDDGLFRLGPSGPCPANLLIAAVTTFESQSRGDLVEPYLRAAIFAASSDALNDVSDGYASRLDASSRLVKLLLKQSRVDDARQVVAALRVDPVLAKAGVQIIAGLERDVAKSSRPALTQSSQLLPTGRESEIAAIDSQLSQIFQLQAPPSLVPAPVRNAGTVAELYGRKAELRAQAGQLSEALKENDRALFWVTRSIAPYLPLRVDFGPAPPQCPPGRSAEPECRQWYDSIVEAYAHPLLSELLSRRMLIEAALGHEGEAVKVDAFAQRILVNWLEKNWDTLPAVRSTLDHRRALDLDRLVALHSIYVSGGPAAEAALEHAFETVQFFQLNRVEMALREAFSRSQASDPAIRAALQDRQVLVDRRRQTTDASEKQQLAAQIARIEAKLPFSMDDFERRAGFHPSSLASVKATLAPDEALVVIVPLLDRTEIFAVTKATQVWAVSPRGDAFFAERVARMRTYLDDPRATGGLDRKAAYEIYAETFARIEPFLGTHRVLVAASGPLSNIPLAILVTRAPIGADDDPNVWRNSGWLVEERAIGVLPSVSSLDILKPNSSRREGLIVFGDPELPPAPDDTLEIQGNGLYRLPLAADEISMLRKGAHGRIRVYDRDKDTEMALKDADLRSTHILAFETHGLVAGENVCKEPCLVMTPPHLGDTEDGFLTASEAMQLHVGADIVVLSACNTAGPDGHGGEGLSGLALSFLFAGGDAVLATHWHVYDLAASAIIGQTLNGESEDILEALRAQMIHAIGDKTAPMHANPRFWGPFVVVGR